MLNFFRSAKLNFVSNDVAMLNFFIGVAMFDFCDDDAMLNFFRETIKRFVLNDAVAKLTYNGDVGNRNFFNSDVARLNFSNDDVA